MASGMLGQWIHSAMIGCDWTKAFRFHSTYIHSKVHSSPASRLRCLPIDTGHIAPIHCERGPRCDGGAREVHLLATSLNQRVVNYIDLCQDDIQAIGHDSRHRLPVHRVPHSRDLSVKLLWKWPDAMHRSSDCRIHWRTNLTSRSIEVETHFIFEKKLSQWVRSSSVCRKKLCGWRAETTTTFLHARPRCDW